MQNQFSHSRVVAWSELDRAENVVPARVEERRFDVSAAKFGERVAGFRDDRAGHEDVSLGHLQAGEQVRARAVVGVPSDGGRDDRAGVSDNLSVATEPVGEQVVVVAAKVPASAGKGSEPGRWPLRLPVGRTLASDHRQDGRHLLVGEFRDKSAQFLPLTAHASRIVGPAVLNRVRPECPPHE